ncbi:MAG: hypothetical protein LQ349_006457 [Xanthoria aureola]|nr:MAG: hypothetical protein LQ349_006457 [Xanthoria aureola]
MDPSKGSSPQGPVPPYEPNPAYAQPPMQHHDSSYNNQIHQYPQQQQYTPMSSPPIHDQPKQEYYSGQENNPTPNYPQQTMPVQQHQAQVAQAYHTATPIANLGEGAAPVDCPCCHMRALTKTEYHSGNTTNAWAAVICFCFCLGCIPYLIRSLKDVEHKCGHCGVLLATWHNSGRVVVHQHA